MGRTACTEPQCLYSRAIPLLLLWAVRPVQSLSACTRVHFTLYHSIFRIEMKVKLAVTQETFIDAGLQVRSQYSEGPATGHLDTGFSRFPCV